MQQLLPISDSPQYHVLVHGAWHGSWCWHKVASRLEKMGHTVVTPDLPGHYSNKADFRDISLESYTNHIEGIIKALPHPIILTGHSMAGIVISQVAENIPDRIKQLVYVSAFIPQDGGSLLLEVKQAAVPGVSMATVINQSGNSISLELDEHIQAFFYGNCSREDIQYALARFQSQPLRPFADKVSLSTARFGSIPKLYIECLQDKAIEIQDQRRMHLKITCDVATLDTDHSPFFSSDARLAQLMDSIGNAARQ